MTISATELRNYLDGFIGTQNYHRTSLHRQFVATDGALAMAEKAGAFWLHDLIMSYQNKLLKKGKMFQVWTMKVKDGKAVVECREDTGKPVLVRQRISYTDFPEGDWKFYVVKGEAQGKMVMVLMLPSEY
jgi:hypothetical protein